VTPELERDRNRGIRGMTVSQREVAYSLSFLMTGRDVMERPAAEARKRETGSHELSVITTYMTVLTALPAS
jgi:hypothetical protein